MSPGSPERSGLPGGTPEPGAARSGPDAEARAAVLAGQALKARPWFSIRMQMYITFALLLVLVFCIAWATLTTSARVGSHVRYFETTTKLRFSIEQARIFERNFLLHEKNLEEAIRSADAARDLFVEQAEPITESIGGERYAEALQRLELYVEFLGRQQQASTAATPANSDATALAVQEQSGWLIGFAGALAESQRLLLDLQLKSTARVQTALLVLLIVYVVGMAILLILRIAQPFERFYNYTRRIASGDITPITPARRYSDEFSILAYRLNNMVRELNRSQQAAARSQQLRAVGTLSASVAHEINNPVNNIMLSACALLEDYDGTSEEERKSILEDIVVESTRTRDIIRRMMDFARQAERQVVTIDLRALADEAVNLGKNGLQRKHIQVEVHQRTAAPLVPGDALQLTQVVLNLIRNAADASPEGGRIEIVLELAAGGDLVALAVRDHGTGIPEEIFPLIFDPFFTTKTRGRGTGLGLAISKEIVQRHGGDLTLQSSPGAGTVATITLPIAEVPADLERSAEAPPTGSPPPPSGHA